MQRYCKYLAFVLLAAALVLGGCAGEPEVVEKEVTVEVEVTREVEVQVTQEIEVTRIVEKEVTVEVPTEPVADVPFASEWVSSAHAETEAEAFVHWDEDDPAVVPANCAKCHSTPGFQDFLGADGSAAGQVDADAPVGTVIECVACHNDATLTLSSVVFPSGAEVAGLGPEAICAQCHQGRASTVSVNAAIEEAGVTDVDAASEELGFVNIHYYAAAATQYGTWAMGGYQYDGQSYDAKFMHVAGYDTCIDCHNQHSLELRLDECSVCHTDVAEVEDLRDARLAGSTMDYDGDGDLEEGVAFEIAGLQEILYQAIQGYAQNTAGAPIIYDEHTHPYFFVDPNANGSVDEGEAVRDNAYNSWTPRLLKAAYNYQTSLKDPGAFAHGGKYVIELLYDSIADLDPALAEGLTRIDAGHFAGSEEAWRHWDEEGEVPGSCSKCHSATGLPTFLAEGVNVSQPLSNGLLCSSCHDAVPGFTRYQVEEVVFPSGARLGLDDPDSNLCLNCHQGRESTVSVNRVIADLDLDTVAESITFRNVHYFAAGATLFGDQAKGAYQYEGQEYVGRFAHVAAADTCTECHDAHELEPRAAVCSNCHGEVESLDEIRMDPTDYDGDGDTAEGIAGEIETMREALYEALKVYASEVAGTAIVYDSHSHPYFFIDGNANGEVDEGEATRANQYVTWTPRLLQAAYNYQYAQKDPGAFAHNAKYIMQVLYDSLASLGTEVTVDMAGMVRPATQ